MQLTRTSIRSWVTRAFLAIVAAILLGLVAQWFIQVATDKGYYNHAGQKWDVLFTALFGFLNSAAMISLAAFMGGLTIGLRVDAYLARRSARRWWENVQAFSIRDAACLLAGVRRSEFETSDRAIAIANELRGYVNSGHAPLFLEIEFERPAPDFSDPKARYEPPYDKKNVGFDAIIPKRMVEGIARGRKWSLPWPLPPKPESDDYLRPIKRPPVIPPAQPMAKNALLGMFGNKPGLSGKTHK